MLVQSIAAVVAFYAASASAHISLAQPIPYGKPDTSPLNPSGSNYPCKTDNGFTVNSVTKMAVGESQKLSFSGTAVHGGGSCQLSLTSGFTPTGSSQFKVIYSIEGGCPGTDASTVSYDFKIPTEVPAGDYTLAWTWFNRIGNREMYMNCAPITVTGGSGSQSAFSALPDMAIFNIQSKNSCGTTEGTDVAFPNPGQYVLKGPGDKPGPPTNCGSAASAPAPAAGAGAGAGAGSGSGSGSSAASPSGTTGNGSGSGAASPSGTTGNGSGSGTGSANDGKYTGVGASMPSGAAVAPQAAAPSAAASSPSPSGGSAGTFAEGSNGGGASSPSGSAAAAAPTQSAASSSPSTAPAAAAPPASNPANASNGGSCSPDGSLVCSASGGQFGLCNWGKVTMMDVAAGTKCVGGQIVGMQKRWFLS